MPGQSRLDSWKEIADYLGRDVRTAMRWAKSNGLPVRRVAGKGRSVFAFTHEIDTWLAGAHLEAGAPVNAPATSDAPAASAPAPSRDRSAQWRWAAGALLLIVVAASALISRRTLQTPDPAPSRVTATGSEVSIVDADGVSSVIHRFDPDKQFDLRVPPLLSDVDGDGGAEVLLAPPIYTSASTRQVQSGELLNLSPAGGARWRFAFDDVLAFGDERFDGPWAIIDWQVEPAGSGRRIALAAHHFLWWPSIVAVLDSTGARLSTFVNPGWTEAVLWIDRDHLAVAGFNNAHNAGMFAVIDPRADRSLAPGTPPGTYACANCGGTAPLFYATFPRSEVNTLLAARFNRAQISTLSEPFRVTTIEVPDDTNVATAIYDFDRSFRLVRARYSEGYWDVHRRLELEGRIAHSRETCPGRNGPPVIHVWDVARGEWRDVKAAAGS